MSRIMTVGYETTPVVGDETAAAPTFEGPTSVGGAGATSAKSTSVKRSGVSSRAFDSGSSNFHAYSRLAWNGVLGRGIYVRAYFLVPALPASTTYIGRTATLTGNFNLIRLTSAGKIVLTDPDGTQIGSESDATIATDTWYRLELYSLAAAGATDACELRLDGVTVASASGQDFQDGAGIDRFDTGWLDPPGASTLIYFDDLAVNDDQGGTQNSWPGPGSVVYLDAISDNARGADWTAGAGATTNLWDAVNGDPPAGVATGSATNTSQIKNTNTADTTQSYDANMETYETAGLGASDTITLVQAVSQVGSTGSGFAVIGASAIVSNPNQGSEDAMNIGTGGVMATYPVEWSSRWTTAVVSPTVTLSSSPVMRVGRRDTQPAEAHLCGMRIVVEYVPGTGGIYMHRPIKQGRGVSW